MNLSKLEKLLAYYRGGVSSKGILYDILPDSGLGDKSGCGSYFSALYKMGIITDRDKYLRSHQILEWDIGPVVIKDLEYINKCLKEGKKHKDIFTKDRFGEISDWYISLGLKLLGELDVLDKKPAVRKKRKEESVADKKEYWDKVATASEEMIDGKVTVNSVSRMYEVSPNDLKRFILKQEVIFGRKECACYPEKLLCEIYLSDASSNNIIVSDFIEKVFNELRWEDIQKIMNAFDYCFENVLNSAQRKVISDIYIKGYTNGMVSDELGYSIVKVRQFRELAIRKLYVYFTRNVMKAGTIQGVIGKEAKRKLK